MERLTHIQINVDCQNDFCPGGSLAVANGDKVIEPLNKISALARELGGTVTHTRDWHPEQTNHFIEFGGPWPTHCVANTEGAAFHPNLVIVKDDVLISKGTEVDQDAFSGFQGKDEEGRTLRDVILSSPAGEIIVTIGGLATDYCVKATVLDAVALSAERPMRIIALQDAMRAVNIKPNDGAEALDLMNEAGAVVMTTEKALQYIRARVQAHAR